MFATVLSDLMRASRLTQKDIARQIGISPAAISQWLSDDTVPRPDVLLALVEFLRSKEISRAVWLRFESMIDQPVQDVSPNFRTSVSSVRDYMESAKSDPRAILRSIEKATLTMDPQDRSAFLRRVDRLLTEHQAQSPATLADAHTMEQIEEYGSALSGALPLLDAFRMLAAR